MSFDPDDRRYTVFVTPHSEGVFVCLRDVTKQDAEMIEIQEGRNLVEQIIELAPGIVYLHDLALGQNVYKNRNVAASLGYDPAEMEQMSPAQLAALTLPEDAQRHQEKRQQFQSGAVSIEFEYQQRHKDGSTRWFQTRETVFGRDNNGNPRLILGFAEDITSQRNVLNTLREREEHLQGLTGSSPDCILTLDLNGGLLHINQSGKTLMAISDFAPLIGAEWTLLFQENYRSFARRALTTALEGGTERFQGVAKTAVGTPIWWDVVVTPIIGSRGKPTQIVTVARDITGFKALELERERLLQDAITRADFDPLTGLLNHRAFHRKLQEAAMVGGQNLPSLAILLIDLENFRYFNEAYGRAVGDDLLIRMAKELSVCCRTDDTLARIGPDEFGIIAPQMVASEMGPYVLRLRAVVDGIGMRSPDGADTIPLHIAVGYALFPEDTASVSAAYDIAEERQRADQTGGHSREAERVRASLRENIDSFGMMDTLIATIDGKDRMTRRQSEDTLIYSRRIADRFGLNDQQKRSLDIAALLHDVGKVGIDERILRQPGKLSDADFAVVQQHPKIGAMLVGSTVDDVDTVEAILYHHENWNGSGYPAGLVGQDIPLMARILNVSSSYAAMTNNRPYRKGMTPNAAHKVLQSGAGSQWDPECVAALIAVANG
ncbi:MAG: diguanylate cyclase [Fibrella sp.]|nr:diguanylate cyclase [Armatimonadota bacterium]